MTTDEFSAWFTALDDGWAEEVATAIDVVERLGPGREAPGSSELLLWYEHPHLRPSPGGEAPIKLSLAALDEWAGFYMYVEKILGHLRSERFTARLREIGANEADTVLQAVERLKVLANPRMRWVARPSPADPPVSRCDEVRRIYFEALSAAGFTAVDVPAHSLALRELSRRVPAPGFRLLYGVDAARDTALFVLGDKLDRSFYGDSVRRAEALWKRFLEGALQGVEEASHVR